MANNKGISAEKERQIYIAKTMDKMSIHATAKKVGVSKATVSKYFKQMDEADYEPPEITQVTAEALKPVKGDEEFDLMGKINASNQDIITILQRVVSEAKQGMEARDTTTGRVIPLKQLADTLKVALDVAKTIEAASANKRLTPETIDYDYLAKMYITFNKETGKFDYNEKKHIKAVLDVAHGKVALNGEE